MILEKLIDEIRTLYPKYDLAISIHVPIGGARLYRIIGTLYPHRSFTISAEDPIKLMVQFHQMYNLDQKLKES